MANTLGDDGSAENDDDRLAELLRVARPLHIDPFRKRRILVRLERQTRQERGERRSLPRFWLRPAVAAALFVSGSAAAELGHRYVAGESGLFGSATRPSHPTSQAPAPAQLPSRVPDCVSSPRASASGVAPSAVPETTRASTKPSARAEPEVKEDPEQIALAIRALRTEGNPSRAQALLDAYLKAHPHGVLAGDALALSIEAASARRDPRAAEYARRYLGRFPRGKYRDLAQRATETQR